jgi:16S rRNA processing protein RimM
MPGPPPGWLRAGRVGRPHGLDGSFHVIEPNASLLGLGGVVVVAGQGRTIVRRAGTDARPVLRVAGCEDRDAAQALSGAELLVARAEAPPLEPDEWWAEDLEGCRVSDGGRDVGTVRRLLALPSCEVLEVARPDGGDLLVPLVTDAVREVDLEHRAIDIDLRFLGED